MREPGRSLTKLPSVFLCISLFSISFSRADDSLAPGPPTVGEGRSYEVVPSLAQVMWTESGGEWTETIQIDGASFLKPQFVDVELRSGESLVVRSITGHIVETITGRGPRDEGTFWGLSALGDTLILELNIDIVFQRPPFTVKQLIVGNDLLYGVTGRSPQAICGPADFEDVICYQSDAAKWANVRASVGLMSIGGDPVSALWCSGVNVSATGAVLTNFHCVFPEHCRNTEFVFKYYNQVCGGGFDPTSDWQGYRGDQGLADSLYGTCDADPLRLDFTLCSILPADGNPSATFGYAIPDPTPLANGEDLYIIQHPDGRPHEITHGGGSDVSVDLDRINLEYDNTLDTEFGSSGSPVFREVDGLLVGLHHCSGCPNRGITMEAIFPLIEPHIDITTVFTDSFESGDTSAWSQTVP